MENSVIIFGNHPMVQNIIQQYHAANYMVDCRQTMSIDGIAYDDYDEICLLPNDDNSHAEGIRANSLATDESTLDFLQILAEAYNSKSHFNKLLVCHLLLHNSSILKSLLISGLSECIKKAFEVHPFTMEDCWAKTVLVHLPSVDSNYPMIDRLPIMKDHDTKVHVVICGFDSYAESMAVNTALTSHFPNYKSSDPHPKRTRITIVDEQIHYSGNAFRSHYQHLFNHSFYRILDLEKKSSIVHYPDYHGHRKDFVDIEWEFVNGSPYDEVFRNKIAKWCTDTKQLLTIIVSCGDDEKDFQVCTSLPYQVYEEQIPVFVRQTRNRLVETVKTDIRFAHLYPFGMADMGYNVMIPLLQMAKLLSYFYFCSYSDNGIPTVFPANEVEEAWKQEKSLKVKFSNICNVMTICSKIHSLGRNPDDVDAYYALTQKEIELLAETEHNRWSVERLIMGARPCTDEEKEEIRKNILSNIKYNKNPHKEEEEKPKNLKKEYKEVKHFDLCAYEDLEIDATGKLASTYDYDLTACIPLLIRSFHLQNHNEGK